MRQGRTSPNGWGAMILAVTDERAFHAWVDESIRLPGSAGYPQGAYFLAAALCDPIHADEIRARLRDLLVGKSDSLHWRLESDKHQDKIAAAVAGFTDVEHVIVVGIPVDGKRQERARRYCLIRMINEFDR